MALTQQQISDHLFLAQQNVSAFLQQLDFDWKAATLDELRGAYIRKLQAQAAGHRSETGLDLVHERVLTERVDRELKQFMLAEKKGQLINVAQLEPELMQMVGAFRSELLGRDDKLKADLDALYGIEVDIQVLNDYTFSALGHLARYDAGNLGDAQEAGGNAAAAGCGVTDELGTQEPAAVG